MNKNPLVSIFLPYYNDRKFLADAIESVLNQTYQNFELFLFNHASTDTSRNIAHSFADPRIHHIDAEKNLGAGSGYNLKITLPMMKGKYVKLLCADDMMKPDGLETLVNFMESNPDKDFAFGNMDYVDENGKKKRGDWFHTRDGFNINNDEIDELISFSKGIGHLHFPGCICKTKCFNSIKIENVFILLFDMTLWVRFLLNGYKIAFINKSVVDYRIHSNQISSAFRIERNLHISAFESIEYCRIFYSIRTLSLLKKVFPTKFSLDLKEGEEKFIPFVVAHHYATSTIIPYKTFGRIELYKMLNDDCTRCEIEKRFGYGIAEFRADYSWIEEQKSQKNIIQNPKSLSLGRLSFLFARKVWLCCRNAVTLRFLRKRKKTQYTV